MKITKFAHACILAEDDTHTLLLDPGQMSWESGLVKVEAWPKLDFVAITHEHFDHFSSDFVKAILAKFPDVQFLTTTEMVAKLKDLGTKHVQTVSNDQVVLTPLAHDSMEPLNPGPMCQNVAIHFNDWLTSPGDSHHLTETKDVLCLPVAGPWGSTINAVRLAVELKPKVVIPIHDWMWNESWRKTMYARMTEFFKSQDITFISPVDGELQEISF